ncbi:MAG: 2-oxoglutarate dehydrogenase E1 component [Chlamydiales bacterium]|nr:2-oxoglutarate dehydrogenase E1 component [Chlamydiales bacterium]
MSSSRAFTYMHLANIEMIEKLHANFLQDPMSVEPSWRYFFDGVEFAEYHKSKIQPPIEQAGDLRIFNLIEAYRKFGHLQARFNPIALQEPEVAHELQLSSLNFDPKELEQSFPTGGVLEESIAPLSKIIDRLQKIYCGTIGIEYMGCHSPEMEKWLQVQIEPTLFRPQLSIEQKRMILHHLNKSELFETFLHTKYTGQKRFSLEGGETLIPILEEIIEKGSECGVDEFVIGMAHRGRLNVLSNILNKSYSMIFSEFEDFYDPDLTEGTGDVKYHKGFSSNITTSHGIPVHIGLTANPSHLESVGAVVAGKVRAKQMQRADVAQKKVVPILIHGDASISGQGVVYETLQLYNIDGYSTGGTVHIVVNNQVGFTTLPNEYRSSRYSTDIAHAFGFPVFHVNAEDPEGCIFATQLALRVRHLFQCDVFIELNCYRKYGHNESDEPAFTQPKEYQIIRNKKSIREIYRDSLIEQGVLEKQMALSLEEDFKKALHYELDELKISKEVFSQEAFGGVWQDYKKASKQELFEPALTSVNASVLKEIGTLFCQIPDALAVHKKLQKLIEQRQKMVTGELPLDWAMGEHFAFATLLWEGVPVRLSGQDCQRGTFTQRHSVWVDQNTGERHFSLNHLTENQGKYTVYNSPLSEFAVLGFELGYSFAYPSSLVMWEAQFGDFANGAQIIFDQYLAASAQKWQRYSGLVLLLPHGYEGQGAEHSSGRIERFLQLAGEMNLQVVNPTTPAQYFHLLRRQVKRTVRVPLVIFTPKGLLRHPECISSLEDLSNGSFNEIIDDVQQDRKARRVLLCSGRIYYDLIQERAKRQKQEVAIIRIEQLYPLQHDTLMRVLKKYEAVKEFYWVQEEPKNMGAYTYISPILEEMLPHIQYVGRNRSASTATGSHVRHQKEHEQVMNMAFGE